MYNTLYFFVLISVMEVNNIMCIRTSGYMFAVYHSAPEKYYVRGAGLGLIFMNNYRQLLEEVE